MGWCWGGSGAVSWLLRAFWLWSKHGKIYHGYEKLCFLFIFMVIIFYQNLYIILFDVVSTQQARLVAHYYTHCISTEDLSLTRETSEKDKEFLVFSGAFADVEWCSLRPNINRSPRSQSPFQQNQMCFKLLMILGCLCHYLIQTTGASGSLRGVCGGS